MAFKTSGGFDFAKLNAVSAEKRAMSPQDRAERKARDDFGHNARHVVNDDDMRVGNSVELRVVTLGADPEDRLSDRRRDVTGEKLSGAIMYMVHHDDGRPFDGSASQDLRRSMYYPSEAERLLEEPNGGHGLDAHISGLRAGSKVSMLGKEVSRNWKDGTGAWKTVREFHAMRMGPGEMTREQLSALDPGGLVAASRRHFRAETDVQREEIAREHLGQEPSKATLSGQTVSVTEVRSTGAKGPSVRDDGIDALFAEFADKASSRTGR